MVLVAPRSAKLVEARGARFTLFCGYVSLLLAFATMLLLWEEDISYWKIGLAYIFIGIGVGFAGTPASHSLTGSVPVRRAGMASGTADLQRDLGGAIMQSIFGALLTAGYATAAAAAIAGAPNNQQVNETVQNELTKSFSSAESIAGQFPQYATQITAAAKAPSLTALTGRTPPGSWPSYWAGRSCSSCSPAPRGAAAELYHAEDTRRSLSRPTGHARSPDRIRPRPPDGHANQADEHEDEHRFGCDLDVSSGDLFGGRRDQGQGQDVRRLANTPNENAARAWREPLARRSSAPLRLGDPPRRRPETRTRTATLTKTRPRTRSSVASRCGSLGSEIARPNSTMATTITNVVRTTPAA